MKISLIIPCYNEEDNIEPFFNHCLHVFEGDKSDIEYIFINDGSKDETYGKLHSLSQQHENAQVTIIDFSRNFGKEAAMYAGMKEASGDYVAIIDADLQQDPSYVLKMKDMLQVNPQLDCIAAVQDQRIENRFMKAIKQRFYKVIDAISEVSFVNGASDFRLMRKKMVNAILSLEEHERFSKGIFSWVGFRVGYITYEVKERQHGKTNWSIKKLFRYAIEGIVSFSSFPLQIAGMLGIFFITSAILFFIGCWVAVLVWHTSISSMILIIALMFLLSGIQLFCMGILGEYLAKTYMECRHRPLYIIRETSKRGAEGSINYDQ